MKKVLFVATVEGHIKSFHIPYLKWFKENGYEVHVATSGKGNIPFADVQYKVSFQRSPFKTDNIKAYKQIKKIIDREAFRIIHCHTPMGGVIARLAAKKARGNGTKVLYTAHGFHFYKGAPMINWMLYYPVEWILSFLTDCLVTINQEDNERAKRRLHAKKVEFMHGVGVDDEKFDPEKIKRKDVEAIRNTFGIGKDQIVLTYVGELQKNQEFLIEVLRGIKENEKNAKLILVGDGKKEQYYRDVAKSCEVEKNVLFAGRREDIPAILAATDIYVSGSKREGLPVNVIEAMLMKKPIVATNIRGVKDLIQDGENGYLVEVGDRNKFAVRICELIKNPALARQLGEAAANRAHTFTQTAVLNEMEEVYCQFTE